MPDLSMRLQNFGAALQSESWSRDELSAFQNRALRILVRHAFERVPYYRDLFQRHRLNPDDIRGIEDLERIPITGRLKIQERPPSDFIASGYNPERLIVHRTSGSTGIPIAIRRTWFEERLLQGVRVREQLKSGLRLTDVRAGVVAASVTHSNRYGGPFWTRFGLLRRIDVDCLAPARTVLSQLAEIRPDVLSGYAGALAWIAGEATAEDRRRIRPRFINSGAETLTPEMRRQITDCFGAPLYDSYAAHEFNLIAHECAETGLYHVSGSSVIAEVLKDGKPACAGESGELIGTALHSFAMPFLRYRLGDVVSRGPVRCPCGAPVATLRSIEGRTIDRFPLPDGTTIHPYHLVWPLAQESPWLRRYQIIQTSIDHIVIKTVPLPGQVPTQDDLNLIHAQTEKAVGPDVAVTLELVTELPPERNGKFRPYYSLVDDLKTPRAIRNIAQPAEWQIK